MLGCPWTDATTLTGNAKVEFLEKGGAGRNKSGKFAAVINGHV